MTAPTPNVVFSLIHLNGLVRNSQLFIDMYLPLQPLLLILSPSFCDCVGAPAVSYCLCRHIHPLTSSCAVSNSTDMAERKKEQVSGGPKLAAMTNRETEKRGWPSEITAHVMPWKWQWPQHRYCTAILS